MSIQRTCSRSVHTVSRSVDSQRTYRKTQTQQLYRNHSAGASVEANIYKKRTICSQLSATFNFIPLMSFFIFSTWHLQASSMSPLSRYGVPVGGTQTMPSAEAQQHELRRDPWACRATATVGTYHVIMVRSGCHPWLTDRLTRQNQHGLARALSPQKASDSIPFVCPQQVFFGPIPLYKFSFVVTFPSSIWGLDD